MKIILAPSENLANPSSSANNSVPLHPPNLPGSIFVKFSEHLSFHLRPLFFL